MQSVVFGKSVRSFVIYTAFSFSSDADGLNPIVALLEPRMSSFILAFESLSVRLNRQLVVLQECSNNQWLASVSNAQVKGNNTWVTNITITPLPSVDRTQPAVITMRILPASFCPANAVPLISLTVLVPNNGLLLPQYAVRAAQGISAAATLVTMSSLTGWGISTVMRLRAQRDCTVAYDDSTLMALGIAVGPETGSSLRGAVLTNTVVVVVVLLVFGLALPLVLSLRCCHRTGVLDCFLLRAKLLSLPGMMHVAMSFLLSSIASASTSLASNPQDATGDVMAGLFGYFVCVCHIGTCVFYFVRSRASGCPSGLPIVQAGLPCTSSCEGLGDEWSYPAECLAATRDLRYSWFPFAESLVLIAIGVLDGVKPSEPTENICMGKTAACIGVLCAYILFLAILRPSRTVAGNVAALLIAVLTAAVGSLVLSLASKGPFYQGQLERNAVDGITLAVLAVGLLESLRQGILGRKKVIGQLGLILSGRTCLGLERALNKHPEAHNEEEGMSDNSHLHTGPLLELGMGFYESEGESDEGHRSDGAAGAPHSEEMALLAGTLRRIRLSSSPPKQFCHDAVDDMLGTS